MRRTTHRPMRMSGGSMRLRGDAEATKQACCNSFLVLYKVRLLLLFSMITMLISVHSKYPYYGLPRQDVASHAFTKYAYAASPCAIIISSTARCPSQTSSPQPRLASSAKYSPSRSLTTTKSRSSPAPWTVASMSTAAYPQTPTEALPKRIFGFLNGA